MFEKSQSNHSVANADRQRIAKRLNRRAKQASAQIYPPEGDAHMRASVLDAGWSAFRTMLRYKCAFVGATFAEVNEAFFNPGLLCMLCAQWPQRYIAGLGIRAWICGECGTVHDRNVNAAKNILAAGRRRLAEGIPALLRAREDVKRLQ